MTLKDLAEYMSLTNMPMAVSGNQGGHWMLHPGGRLTHHDHEGGPIMNQAGPDTDVNDAWLRELGFPAGRLITSRERQRDFLGRRQYKRDFPQG